MERNEEHQPGNRPEDQERVQEGQTHNHAEEQRNLQNTQIVKEGKQSTGTELKSETIETKSQKNKIGLHFLLGGIAGGVVSAVIMILLLTGNIISLEDSTNTSASNEGNNTPEIVETLSSDGAEEATTIEETSEAIVGVINLQKHTVWTESEEAGTGSGIIYKKENGKAYVVTNQHVVESAEEVEIVLNNEERIQAKVLGTDALTDLAVLEVEGEQINTVASIGSSENLKVGETVIAIGNPLGMDFANTVTKGIVSGLNRSVSMDTDGDRQPDWVTEVIQTDAAINPGNSGGALVNTGGEVIGINSMKVARQEVEGIGFAIPIDAALPIMEQLETNSEIERPQIGISTASLNQVPPQFHHEITLPEEVEGGMVIAEVQAGSSAEEAGLQQFDVITNINGNEITSILELRKFLYSDASIGDTVEIEYYRDGNLEKANLTLQAQQ